MYGNLLQNSKLWGKFSSYLKKHTLPHDDFAASVGCVFCESVFDNSSASPHEQSLQALRFPVVPQTKKNYV